MFTKKKLSFFCEKCGIEVKQNETACPGCGRFFASIRCPSCNFSGNSQDFSSGCPKCGYAMDKKRKKIPKKKYSQNDGLPFWIYLVALALLIGVLFFF